MAQKTATLYARIEPDVKEQAESILSELGIPASNAINMFYKQVIMHRGLPFPVRLPSRRTLSMSDLSREEFSEALEVGYADVLEGHVRPAADVFADLAEEYGI